MAEENAPKRLKRVVIKEELVALTGHHISALALNQLLYWTFDLFMVEEAQRAGPEHELPLTHGWIYKSAKELIDELMLDCSPQTMRRYLAKIIEGGWIEERDNPKNKWDQTKQYRADIRQIQTDLLALGFALEGYELPPFSKMEIGASNLDDPSSDLEDRSDKNGGAIPETTTETTPESTSDIDLPSDPPSKVFEGSSVEETSGTLFESPDQEPPTPPLSD